VDLGEADRPPSASFGSRGIAEDDAAVYDDARRPSDSNIVDGDNVLHDAHDEGRCRLERSHFPSVTVRDLQSQVK
jgi:hypothetical protein